MSKNRYYPDPDGSRARENAEHPKPGATMYAFWYTNSVGYRTHRIDADRKLVEFWREGKLGIREDVSEIFVYKGRPASPASTKGGEHG